MSKDRIQKLLRKIGVLLQDDELSALEKDLAKKYLIEIYDLIDEGGKAEMRQESQLKNDHRKNDRSKLASPYIPQSPKVNTDVVEAISDQVVEVYKEAHKIDPVRAKSFDSPIEPPEQFIQKVSGSPEAEISGKSKRVTTQPFPQETPLRVPPDFKREISEVVTRVNSVPEQHKVLFKREQQNELSDKLSLSPISDLRRALGINDKLLVVNGLFTGDHESYQETIDVLNAKYSFADAQSYLVRYVIDKFDWLNEERVDSARDFIKLVERRFLET